MKYSNNQRRTFICDLWKTSSPKPSTSSHLKMLGLNIYLMNCDLEECRDFLGQKKALAIKDFFLKDKLELKKI